MTNNTLSGFQINKVNTTPNTTTSGAKSQGATLQTHNKYWGTFVLNGATPVTVVEPNVTTKCIIPISLNTVGGTVGAHPTIQTITVGIGFTVQGTASDTSTYAYTVEGFL